MPMPEAVRSKEIIGIALIVRATTIAACAHAVFRTRGAGWLLGGST